MTSHSFPTRRSSDLAEIKGFQDPSIFVDVVKKEVERQLVDLKEKKKVKEEVRGANEDATTKFLRPLPGSARMYPETDLPLLHISKEIIDRVKRSMPKLKSEMKEELIKSGISEELAKLILQKDKLSEFKELATIIRNPNLIAKMITLWRDEIAKHKGIKEEQIEEILNVDLFEDILKALLEKKIREEDVKVVMNDIADGKTLEDAMKKEKVDNGELEEEIMKLIKEKPGLREGAYMGLLMAKYKGKFSGKELMDLIKKYMK
jgi:glutamyl-tRNA(Gln) amidotransferase subunit E